MRDIAAELQHNLHKKFVAQGIVKPSCELSSILNTEIKDITNLTTNDVVVIWGGMRDVIKSEVNAGLSQIRKFVEKHKNTNVLVMELPDWCDLSAKSCVNVVCKGFNRKCMQFFFSMH